ncbi:universal stress protein [Acidiplasma cupricumulans]|uniref:universal stress protein n=1 Tax=Acidiplasma cupricumulans TaxID=312540 RepID=UPI000B1A2217|nr:universal stress protein [Acidiplasma cupricumulans]
MHIRMEKRRGLKVIPKITTSDNVRSGLLKEASSHYYDMLLMATHKRAMLSGSIFGSIGDYILKNIDIPVALLSISEREYPYKKILLPVAESINTRAAVYFGIELAKINHAKIIILI